MALPTDTQVVSRREKFFGAAVGVSVGLFCIGLAITYSATLVFFLTVGTLGLALLAPPVLGGVVGFFLAWLGHFRRMNWLHVALVILIGWPSAAYLAPSIRIRHAHQLANSLPVFPQAETLDHTFEPFDSDAGPAFVGATYQTHASRDAVLDFYAVQLRKQGWKPVSACDTVGLCFSKKALLLHVMPYDARTWDGRVDVRCEMR